MTRPDYWKDCTIECEREAECVVCRKYKAPHGRSVPLAMANSRCDWECPGYSQEPKAPHLWPGELAEMDRVEDSEP